MKKIEAILTPFKLYGVKKALARAGMEGFIVSKVKGFGRQKGPPDLYRGNKFIAEFLPKLKIETPVNDDKAAQVVKVIRKAARTRHIGNGKVFELSVDEVVRIRTSEYGSYAI